MPSPYRAVLFDFDYTLADSSRAVVECVDFAFVLMGLPPADPTLIRSTIGLSLPETLVQLAGAELKPRTAEFRRYFKQRSDQVMVAWTALLEHTPRAVADLRERGLGLGIVSTKYRMRIEATLAKVQMEDHFDVVVGGEDVSAHKPDPEGLLQALDKLNREAAAVVYVGDSEVDAQAADAAGVDFVAVLSGTTPRGNLEPYDPVAILDGVGDLAGWLSR